MIPRCLTAFSLGLVLVTPSVPGETLDRIVLRVNGEILTLHEYETRREAFVTSILGDPEISAEDRQDRLSKVGKVILWDAYREMLLLSRADQMAVSVDDDQIDGAIADIRARQGIETEEQFRQALAMSNMTVEDLREKMKTEILWSRVVGEEVTRNIEVPEEELRAHYRAQKEEFTIAERRKVEEVIVLDSGIADAAQRQALAERISEEANAAGGFSGVELPEGDVTSPIDLGWLTREDLDPALAEVGFDLEPGAVSEPVEGRGGLHVLHVTEVEEGRVRPFSEVKDSILARERNRRFDNELREYLARLESRSYIVEDLPADAVGYRELAGTLETSDSPLELFRDPEARLRDTARGDESDAEAAPESTSDAG